MCLSVDEDAKSVELIMDTSIDTRAEWIPGEGGDVCLYRSQEDEHVVGVRLPLKKDKPSRAPRRTTASQCGVPNRRRYVKMQRPENRDTRKMGRIVWEEKA